MEAFLVLWIVLARGSPRLSVYVWLVLAVAAGGSVTTPWAAGRVSRGARDAPLSSEEQQGTWKNEDIRGFEQGVIRVVVGREEYRSQYSDARKTSTTAGFAGE